MNKPDICPDISVIVPVYNVEEFLEECLDSLKNQGDVSVEVIIVDDGSTDSSGEIADRYANENDNYRVYHIENGGLGHARNFGVSLAAGKYIFFMDSDDVIPEGTLCNMYALSEKNGSEMTICNVARFNSNKIWESGIHRTVFENVKYITHISENPELLFDTTSWNKLILREFYLRNQFAFPEDVLYEDIPVTIPMHILANKVSVYNAVGYLWRVRESASKSITQNTESIKNLVDRIKIIRMLDKFFEENVSDGKLNIEKQKKALRIDLNIFVNVCSRIDRESALEMMKLINEYLDEAISDEAMNSVSVILRQKYACIRAYDYETLAKVCSYEKSEYKEAPIKEKDGRLIASLDNELFTVSGRDVTDEIRAYPVRRYIDSVEQSKATFTIHAHIYKRRVSLPDRDSLKVKAYLFNVITGEEYPLPLEREACEKLTQLFGTVTNPDTGAVSSYNYDESGFAVTVDVKNLVEQGCPEGRYFVVADYENRYYSGRTILAGAGSGTLSKENSRLVSGDAILKANFLSLQEMSFTLTKNNVFAKKIRADGQKLVFRLNADDVNLFAKCGDKTVLFKHHDENEFSCDVSEMNVNENFAVFAERHGNTIPLISGSRNISRFKTAGNHTVVSTLKTKEYLLRTVDIFVKLNDYEVNDNIISLKTFADADAENSLAVCDSAKIFVKDVLSGEDVVLGKSKCKITEKGKIRCKFIIDFSNDSVIRNFYTSERQIFVKFFKGNEVVCVSPVYSEIDFKAVFDFETLKIKTVRGRCGEIGLNIWSKWKESDNTAQKRKIIKLAKYPQFLKEPIDSHLIVFESMWGTKYSCNVQALYEYIDENYPEYKCVWFFDDDRTPIKGNGIRVKRRSEEYWYYLATAKYFVNNVNFETEYIKRKGQIHIQTMHGTPLKTLGLDVKADFLTQKSVETYIEKCNRWDYLIVQGKFMEDKADQCFKFNKCILKTGYPRTDSLYSVTQEKISEIRRSLNLPKDKKIILYAPTWRTKNKFDMKLDIEKMRQHLSDEYILLVRLHHLCSQGCKIPADGKFVFDLNDYIYVDELYLISDILITDYSSVMFDYALLDKPMLFFTYDFDTYCSQLRGIYVDFKKEAPGPLLYTCDEVIAAIENIDEEMKKCSEKVRLFKEKYLTYENGNSAEKVVKKVIKPSKIGHLAYRIKQKLK